MPSAAVQRQIGYLVSYYTNVPLLPPEYAAVAITFACSARCRVCPHWKVKMKKEEELGLPELKRVIDQLAEMGVQKFDVTGGEPLMRPETALGSLRYASRAGMETYVTTNGLPFSRKLAAELVSCGVQHINVSLDGARAETHDYIRGIEGCFRRAMRSLGWLLEAREKGRSRCSISLTTIVCDRTVQELVEIYRLVERMGLDGVTYNPYVLDNYLYENSDYQGNEFWIKGSRLVLLEEQIAELARIKLSGGKVHNEAEFLRQIPPYFRERDGFRSGVCLAGVKNLYINPLGQIDICAKGPKIQVREVPIREAWKSRQFCESRLAVRRCRTPCLYTCFERLSLRDVFRKPQRKNA